MKRGFKISILLLLLVLFVPEASVAEKERWLQKTGFGLMFHYEAFRNHTSKSYNKTVDSFEVPGFARAVAGTR